MTDVPPFAYQRVADLDSALAALAEGARPIHGGTEFLPAMGLGLFAPEKIVSIRQVDELRICGLDGDYLLVGAGLTHLEVSDNQLIRTELSLLAEVAEGVGNIRVRSTGTIGGNLVFAEPRSDLATALLALGAEIRLVGPEGGRQLPLSEFLVGPYEVDLRPGELVLAVAVRLHATDFAVYKKIVLSERPVVGVALVRHLDGPRWRLVVGAVGLDPTIVETDELTALDPGAIAASIDPTRDLSGSEEYKRHLTVVTIERSVAAAATATDGEEL